MISVQDPTTVTSCCKSPRISSSMSPLPQTPLWRVLLCLVALGAWQVVKVSAELPLMLPQDSSSDTDNELVDHDVMSSPPRISHSGHFPPKFLRISPNPLRDEPNLSSSNVRKHKDNAIHGSHKAYFVTKLDYLKKEWCKTELVKQTIKKKGCLNKTILNRFCYGQCNSFFIPRRRGKDIETNAFESCAFCRPKTTDFVRVTLNCPDKAVKRIRKRVEVIKSCSCMALNLD